MGRSATQLPPPPGCPPTARDASRVSTTHLSLPPTKAPAVATHLPAPGKPPLATVTHGASGVTRAAQPTSAKLHVGEGVPPPSARNTSTLHMPAPPPARP